jgi:tRNA(Arg) A34 adenosine deaminase TadA
VEYASGTVSPSKAGNRQNSLALIEFQHLLPRNTTLKLDHERHMRRAIALANHTPELPFGAVIVHRESGDTVAEGWNRSMINPIWHGEIDAINALFGSGYKVDGSELTLYTTAEPCPMCMAAIL